MAEEKNDPLKKVAQEIFAAGQEAWAEQGKTGITDWIRVSIHKSDGGAKTLSIQLRAIQDTWINKDFRIEPEKSETKGKA